jgi:hypothetical protein
MPPLLARLLIVDAYITTTKNIPTIKSPYFFTYMLLISDSTINFENFSIQQRSKDLLTKNQQSFFSLKNFEKELLFDFAKPLSEWNTEHLSRYQKLSIIEKCLIDMNLYAQHFENTSSLHSFSKGRVKAHAHEFKRYYSAFSHLLSHRAKKMFGLYQYSAREREELFLEYSSEFQSRPAWSFSLTSFIENLSTQEKVIFEANAFILHYNSLPKEFPLKMALLSPEFTSYHPDVSTLLEKNKASLFKIKKKQQVHSVLTNHLDDPQLQNYREYYIKNYFDKNKRARDLDAFFLVMNPQSRDLFQLDSFAKFYHHPPKAQSKKQEEKMLAKRLTQLRVRFPHLHHHFSQDVLKWLGFLPFTRDDIFAEKERLALWINQDQKSWPLDLHHLFYALDPLYRNLYLNEIFVAVHKRLPQYSAGPAEKILSSHLAEVKTYLAIHPSFFKELSPELATLLTSKNL